MKKCTRCGETGEGDKCPACGAPFEEETVQTVAPAAPVPAVKSDFTGGAFANYFIALLTNIVSGLTLGIALPWMTCWHERWVAEHTFINGRRLRFDGKGGELFGKYIIWLLLSIVTFGIYGMIFMPIRLQKWKTENTHFEDGSGVSQFDGTVGGYFGVNLLTSFVTFITLSFGFYWAYCYRLNWVTRHQVIDGERLDFDGKGMQFFGKCIVWVLLTFITVGIYSFWLTVKIKKWTVLHTNIAASNEPVPAKPVNGFAVAGLAISILAIIFAAYCAVAGIIAMIGMPTNDPFIVLRSISMQRMIAMNVGFVFGIAGLALSIVGKMKVAKIDSGKTLSFAGIIIGAISLAMIILSGAGPIIIGFLMNISKRMRT